MKKTLLAATTLALALTGITPAMASDFSFVASKTQNLSYEGETIEVTLNNVPEGQGVYVRLCAVVPTGRPTDCFGAGTWATTDPAALRMGAVPIVNGKVQLAVKGAFQTGGTSFGGQVTPLRDVDCSVVECAVHTRRDHFGTADTSMDAWSPVTFAAPAAAGTVNVGSFNGKLVVYALGLDGARISWKVAGRWGVANAQGNTLNRFDRPVRAAGRDVVVEIYVDRVLRMTKTVRTVGPNFG